MKAREKIKSEETKLAEEELTDLTVDEEQAAEMKGGAIAGIVIAATSDNDRIG